MQRAFLSRIIICLIPTLLATGLVAWAYTKDPTGLSGFRRGIDLSGGTILVYEVDQTLSKQNRGIDDHPGDRAIVDSALADAIKRRIDDKDLLNVIVRPLGQTRVEIIMPFGAPTKDGRSTQGQNEVDDIKRRINDVGSLEFRIVANVDDDKDAIDDVKKFLADSKNADALKKAAETGAPPPFPNRTGDAQLLVMDVPVRYEWVELAKNERYDLGLSSTATTKNSRGHDYFATLETARNRNEAYVETSPVDKGRTGAVYYSRKSENLRDKAESEKKKFDYFVLTRVSEKDRVLVGGDVTISANVTQDEKQNPAVGFTFNSRGGDKFFEVTSRNKPSDPSGGNGIVRKLAIILDQKLISAPTLNQPIRTNGIIQGSFKMDDVQKIVKLLRQGALPATLKKQPVSENTIGPTLGADTIRNGTRAVGFAFAAILVFMMVYYRFAGVVATIALLANLLLTIGFMLLVNATFTLPGLAGIVLMLGMAVDANVLIYERVREERDRGLNLTAALRNGYDRALPTIIDTHLSSIFTAIVLYAVGNDQLKGFGISLTVGLVISLFTSLYMTRLIFDIWQSSGKARQLSMMKLFSKPNIDFMKIRQLMFTITGILTVLGVGLFFMRGQRGLNVDFVGGTAFSGQLDQPLEIGELRKLLSEDRQKERLNVTEVKETSTRKTYEIHYADGGTTTVSLANEPDGSTPEAQLANVKARASVLPDWSVEQIFTSESKGDSSRIFNVRSTERESELVQASINRLFTNPAGKSLLLETNCTPTKQGNDWILTFNKPVSKSYVKTLIEKQFQKNLSSEYVASDVFEITEAGEEKDGRYEKMRLEVFKEANDGIAQLVKDPAKLDLIVNNAAKEFSVKPQAERLETFDGTLASETRSRALYAIVASWIAILMYLWFRFGNWTFGAAALICLIHDLCFTLGAIAACYYLHDTFIGKIFGLQDFKIDLPAVAALLTLVGYSVNDTIVVFDRIKEVRGKNPALNEQMINDSVNQTLSRTVLASLTTFLVVIVLYAFGGEGVHLFAFVMVVGVIVGTYSSIYIAAPLLLVFGEGKPKPVEGMSASVATLGAK
ncbi:protein translocase subunit SecDF [Zavarzinella formosa]|uniref:protein translocase subunit SecDF n=1 Tax=Zavarzinella formosa TaxID=360055 RepID=UPI0002FF311B|nr:protein translocase subunit SecDF [Zavarzinella formosa]